MSFFASCRVCGCTENNACVDTRGCSCSWISDGRCSHCALVDPADPHPELPLLALSIRDPWAWAIVNLGKTIENRTWSTKYRGRIAIHAAKGMKDPEFDHAMSSIDEILGEGSFEHTVSQHGRRRAAYDAHARTRGSIVATARLKWCVSAHESPWFFGPYGFELENVTPIEPIKVAGSPGLFDWRRNLARAS